MATKTARTKKKNSAKGRVRSDAPRDYWHGRKHLLNLGLQEFRVTVLRAKQQTLHLDDLVEGISWTEPADSAITTGEVRYRKPATGSELHIRPGDQVRVDYSAWGQKQWKKLWTMRAYEPSATLADGTRSISLANDLLLLSRSIDDFNYSKSKTRPHGWTISQAVKHVCRRFGLRIGRIPTMRHRVKKKSWLDTSPLRVINDLMLMQRNYTGRRYVLRFQNGKLNILPLKRSLDLMILGPTLIDASLQQSFHEAFATALTVRSVAQTQAGPSASPSRARRTTARKINVKIRSRTAMKRYGYVHRIVYAHGATSTAEARRLGLRYLAKIARMKKEMTLNHVGIPTLHKGDALRLQLPELGLKQVVYVSEITHTVSAGDYTMDVTVMFDDPYVDVKASRVDENKEKTALDRKRKTTTSKPKKKKESQKQQNRKDKIPAVPKETPGEKLKRVAQR